MQDSGDTVASEIRARRTLTSRAVGTGQYVLLTVVAGLLAALVPLLFLDQQPASAVTTPPGFTDSLVTGVADPTAMAFTPDGRMLVTSQGGQLRVYKDGSLLPDPALDLSGETCTDFGRGLLGVAVDPDFPTNHYIYLYYTFNKYGDCAQNTDNVPVNRVERYVLSDSNKATPDKVLIDNMQNMKEHSAGDLHFGKDGNLYVTTGDGGCYYKDPTLCGARNQAAREMNVLLGKVLRITRDGGIPPTNPFQGTDSVRCNAGKAAPGQKCQEIFASGLRNPFRFAFDPNAPGTRFFVNDVGQGFWEEVNKGLSGADYGWNRCEGNHDNPKDGGNTVCDAAPLTPPIREYSHDTGCSSVTGGAFVPDGAWSAAYDDAYIYGDYVCGKMFKLKPDGSGGFTQTEFVVTGAGRGGPVHLLFGPHGGGQSLYYTSYENGGEIRRIDYVGNANRAPNAALAADPTDGLLPLGVNFDASGSSDPDAGDTLTYLWDFGDGSPTTQTAGPTISHEYTTRGTYTATVRAKDDQGAISDPATVRIDAGNRAPNPTMGSPEAGMLFRVGQQIRLLASATDPEDGTLDGSTFEWKVLQHHTAPNPHVHPYFTGTGNDLRVEAPAPEDLDSTGAGNYLEVRLTVTDSKGLSRTLSRDVQPNRVEMSFQTQPKSDLKLKIDGASVTAPESLTSWEGNILGVEAPAAQTAGARSYEFSSWSDGGTRTHNILTPGAPATYTANYAVADLACTMKGTAGDDVLVGTADDDVICGGKGNDTLRGLGGNDTLKGGAGQDIADYSGSASGVSASLSAGTASGEGSDSLVGVENLAGSAQKDTLTGNGDANSLNGNFGADILNGGGGGDNLLGSAGNDTLDGKNGNDTIKGEGNNDSLKGGAGDDEMFGGTDDDALDSRDGVSGNDALDGGTDVNGDTATTDATERSIVGIP